MFFMLRFSDFPGYVNQSTIVSDLPGSGVKHFVDFHHSLEKISIFDCEGRRL